ncbi:MAG TPA: thermonuclease family protein [Pyrinomonadaceae bacterium]|jgi:endonuclease YncB( thermonuclease family)|nr:thermonuclease family protein [Pyrinomonadaceae bacterium]
MTRYLVLGFLLVTSLAGLTGSAEASTLFGRVIEVNDGDVITVFNLNRPVRIKLLAVDAPEAGQTFGDVAKKHLTDLVYDRSVLVEYQGISADGSLVGRVMLDKTDMGAQMIRDGAAWFDASNYDRLTAADREVYQQSEQAARRERRGLWQAENPIAPWEFVRAKTLKRIPAASHNAILPAAKARDDRPTPELTSFTLLATRMGASSAAASRSDAGSGRVPWGESARKNWHVYKPTGENFTALIPEDGRHSVLEVPHAGETYDLHVYAARDGWAMYALMWITGPTNGETDKAVADQMVRKFLEGFSEGYKQKTQQAFTCELEGETRTSVNGFSRSEFELSSCTIPAKVRVYTRVRGGDRQVYAAVVFYVEEEENVSRFINSFTVAASVPKSRSPKR